MLPALRRSCYCRHCPLVIPLVIQCGAADDEQHSKLFKIFTRYLTRYLTRYWGTLIRQSHGSLIKTRQPDTARYTRE
jgi:hypothetical protein